LNFGDFPQNQGIWDKIFFFQNIFQRVATFHYKKKSLVDFTFKNVIFEQVFAFILQCLIFGFLRYMTSTN
jgi:hypothetical protein